MSDNLVKLLLCCRGHKLCAQLRLCTYTSRFIVPARAGGAGSPNQHLADLDPAIASAVSENNNANTRAHGAGAAGDFAPTGPAGLRSCSRGTGSRAGVASRGSRGTLASRGTAGNLVSNVGSLVDVGAESNDRSSSIKPALLSHFKPSSPPVDV